MTRPTKPWKAKPRTGTRAGTGRPAPVRTVPPPARTDGRCCDPTLVATFRQQTLAELEHRHTGPHCASAVTPVDIPTWLTGDTP